MTMLPEVAYESSRLIILVGMVENYIRFFMHISVWIVENYI